MISPKTAPLYDQIYAVVRQIPPGRVATYGQIASIVGGCSARMVGYALAALKHRPDTGTPWQRVINRQGKISLRADGGGAIQRELLEAEGIRFDPQQGTISFAEFGWDGPDIPKPPN
jgi:methylated-DNA-protein-cysteine methyltransferase-like protein